MIYFQSTAGMQNNILEDILGVPGKLLYIFAGIFTHNQKWRPSSSHNSYHSTTGKSQKHQVMNVVMWNGRNDLYDLDPHSPRYVLQILKTVSTTIYRHMGPHTPLGMLDSPAKGQGDNKCGETIKVPFRHFRLVPSAALPSALWVIFPGSFKWRRVGCCGVEV